MLRERGMVLWLVLVFTLLITLILVQLSDSAFIAARLSSNHSIKVQRFLFLEGVVYRIFNQVKMKPLVGSSATYCMSNDEQFCAKKNAKALFLSSDLTRDLNGVDLIVEDKKERASMNNSTLGELNASESVMVRYIKIILKYQGDSHRDSVINLSVGFKQLING